MIDPWLMLGAAALLLRAAFAIYVAGLSRSKNTASTLFRSVVEIAVGLLAWWAIGAAIHGSWQEIAHPVGSASLFIAATFLLPPAVVSGATVERSRSIVPIAAALLLPGLLTPILWKILQSNWLVTNGFIDEAGATFIHFSAGCAALVACIAVGPRIGKYNRDGSTNAIVAHNLPLATVGLLLIFIAWLPYVAGYASASPADAALNASLAAAAAVVAAFIYCAIRYGRQDIFLVYAALLGGLVSITAAPDLLTPSRAVFTGAVAGLIIPFAVVKLDMNFHVDDPAGGIAIHGVGGILGALAIALLQPGSFSQRFDHLGAQLVALIVVAIITLAAAGGVFFGLKLVTRIRCSEADEFEGLDLSEYDLNAYPDFQQTTIKSYHLREMQIMALEVGIVGLPNVGKSTIFNALTAAGALAANYPFATIEPNVGVVSVPDERLKIINQFQETEKIIPAALRVVDIAGIVRGASTGEGLGNKFLSHIREVDAILHVVRCFEGTDIIHVEGTVDPIRDVDTIDTELALADLETVEASLDKSIRLARSGDKDATIKADLLKRAKDVLDQAKPVRSLDLDPDEKKMIKSLGLITAKKVLYVANVDESDIHGAGPLVKKLRERAATESGAVVPVCGKLEAELAELPESDRGEMLAAMDLKEPALATLTREAYQLLGLQSYFTSGPKEIRAWTIPIGATAPQAAGVIHTDFERGFIRAEVYTLPDLQQFKTELAIKAAGKMRAEGKSYIMHDGDIVHFLFNV